MRLVVLICFINLLTNKILFFSLIPTAVPTQKLKVQFSTKTKKFKTEVTKNESQINTSNLKKPFQCNSNTIENNTVSNVDIPHNISCNVNPLLVGSTTDVAKLEKTLKLTGFNIPNVCKIESNQDAGIKASTNKGNNNICPSVDSKNLHVISKNNLDSNKPQEFPKTVEILQKKLEASHNILINTQKENLLLKRQLSKVKMIIKNHETRYDCLEKRLNKFKMQISRLRQEKKKLFLDNKKCLISQYVENDLEKKKCLRYTETDKFFSLSLYLCSKYVYKSMQKHFLLPSICSINEWLQDTNLVEECKKKIPESEMFRDNETDENNSSELIELEYIDVA